MIQNMVYGGSNKTVHKMSAEAYRGFSNMPSDEYLPGPDVKTFTMPRDGVVYYGGIAFYDRGTATGVCRIYKNNVVQDNRDSGNDYIIRGTMVDKQFNAVAGDEIKIECSLTVGTGLTFIQSAIVY